jgi:hypothetical protein
VNDLNFYIWVVYQRRSRVNCGHGPERISLLYIRGEGISTYKAIYNQNRFKPMALVIKGVDIGFGRNWTLFEKKDAIFERTVLANKAGFPDYIFADGRYYPEGGPNQFTDYPYWSNYQSEISNRNFLRIWSYSENKLTDRLEKRSKNCLNHLLIGTTIERLRFGKIFQRFIPISQRF